MISLFSNGCSVDVLRNCFVPVSPEKVMYVPFRDWKLGNNCVTLPCARAKLQQQQHTYRVIDENFIVVQKDAAMWAWAQQRRNFQQTIFLFADFIFASTQNKRRSLTFECRIWYGFEAPIAWHSACSFRHLFLPLPRFLQWFARVWYSTRMKSLEINGTTTEKSLILIECQCTIFAVVFGVQRLFGCDFCLCVRAYVRWRMKENEKNEKKPKLNVRAYRA